MAATVVRIVDGDTIVVNLAGRATTVRILNIDTPEVHKPGVAVECLGPEAAAALRALLPGGTAVGLTFDAQRTDRYGRTLAAVRVAGRDVGTTMAAQGWTAAVVVRGNSRFQMVVAQGQAEAMVAHRGLWNPAIACTLPGQVRSATAALAVPKGAATARPQQRAALTKQLAPAVASATALRASLLQPDDQQPVALRERYPATWRAQQARLLDDALRTARAAIG